MPIIEVHGSVVRCTGVHEIGLGHPVQYIQLDKRHKYTPVTCKWCGLRYKMASSGTEHFNEAAAAHAATDDE